jgi:hypothetical protein
LADFFWKQSQEKANEEGADAYCPEVESPTH